MPHRALIPAASLHITPLPYPTHAHSPQLSVYAQTGAPRHAPHALPVAASLPPVAALGRGGSHCAGHACAVRLIDDASGRAERDIGDCGSLWGRTAHTSRSVPGHPRPEASGERKLLDHSAACQPIAPPTVAPRTVPSSTDAPLLTHRRCHRPWHHSPRQALRAATSSARRAATFLWQTDRLPPHH